MSINEIVKEIINKNEVDQVMHVLIDYMQLKNKKDEDALSEAKASLKAIKKINNHKNDAIDALCEEETK